MSFFMSSLLVMVAQAQVPKLTLTGISVAGMESGQPGQASHIQTSINPDSLGLGLLITITQAHARVWA